MIRNQDFAKADPDGTVEPQFHFTDTFGSRTSEGLIWFRTALTSPTERTRVAKEAAVTHLRWKIQAEVKYIQACKDYVKARKVWEWVLVESVKSKDVDWPTTANWNELWNKANPWLNPDETEDYRQLVETEEIGQDNSGDEEEEH